MSTSDRENFTPDQDHVGASRQYMRDVILGVNDGLVSMILLVAGVVGGGLDAQQVLLTGIAGALAGAVSMAAGEYLATKSQEEVFEAEMEVERRHVEEHRDYERDELRIMFADFGVPVDRLDELVDILDADDETLLNIMAAVEFGLVDSERRNPFLAAVASGLLFLLGSAPSVLPFVFTDDPGTGLVVALVFSSIGLFTVGALKTLVTRKNVFVSGFENLAIGVVGGAVSFGVGRLFGVAVG